MAANKFATMLHRNTNKITLVLVYAFLEWVLIMLLLLNSLFSYLIIKFADYFGLKRPCIWCTRIDHIIERGKIKNSCRDLVCEAHAFEISKLGFCSDHRKLAESKDMCEDCSSSSSQPNYAKLPQSLGFFPWMKQIGMIQGSDEKEIEKVEEDLKCSCCGVNIERSFSHPCILLKPSMDVLGDGEKQNLITVGGVDGEIEDGDYSDQRGSYFLLDHHEEEQNIEENRGIHMVFEAEHGSGRREEDADENCACSVCDVGMEIVGDETHKLDLGSEKGKETLKEETLKEETLNDDDDDQACGQNTSEINEEISTKHLDFFIHGDNCQLIPVELVDSASAEGNENQSRYKGEGEEDFILDFDKNSDHAEAEPVIENWHVSGDTLIEFSSQENNNVFKENKVESSQLRTRGLQVEEENLMQMFQNVRITQTAEDMPNDDDVEVNVERRDVELHSNVSQASSEDPSQIHVEEFEAEAEVSIGTEIPDQDQVDDDYQSYNLLSDANQRTQEDSSTSTDRFHVQDGDSGHGKGEDFLEFKTMSFELRMPTVNNHLPSSSSLEVNENGEEKVPDTPTSVESLHTLHRKMESGTEESLDGSVLSDIECGELTVENLKSALKSERHALKTLYAELEEERNASAIAANQTMAMINRLQEEKSAMQMEALQYQRMMDEQSEYDQEALQLLNELMTKREKEKQEVEKELEVYRKKVHEFEVREKMMMSMSRRTSSPSCSNAEDSDGLSLDLNHEATKEENGFDRSHQECSSNQNTPVDAALYLEESLANFEEERLSILEQLKVLEEKLVMMNYEEEHSFEYDDAKSSEHLFEENGNGYHHDHENGFANGNGKHHQGRKINGAKAKRLLPLFDAISTEEEAEVEENAELSGDENEIDDLPHLQNGSGEKVHLDKERVGLEEEVNHVYERLQVLEADREFLKHCVSSLRKGDKGLDLLQEILQHLRDLRSVELRVKNMEDLAV